MFVRSCGENTPTTIVYFDCTNFREPSSELCSSSRSTPNIAIAEKKMNEQMLRGPSSVNSTIIEDSISNQPVELNAKSSVEPKISLNNGGQIDARLTKAPPTKTTSIPSVVKSSVQSLSQASSSQATAFPTNMSRLNLLNAGTAVPFSQAIVKTHQNYVVKAINNNATTPFGQLCKVTCTSSSGANNQLWETYVGSQVVSFCLCAKYVLICSIDGTIRFIDIKSGVLVLPIMKMFTPAIQSVFVS